MKASDTPSDHPKVIVFPPLIPAATIAAAILLQWRVPLHVFVNLDGMWRIAIGTLLMAGVLLAVFGARSPHEPSTVLVTDSVFRWTRNPFYTGGTLTMIGLALLVGLDWLVILALPSSVFLHFGIVRPEEDYLSAKFGKAYQRYMARVPRYLWPL